MVNALVNLSKPESKACREMIARYVRVNPTGGGGSVVAGTMRKYEIYF